MMACWQLAYTLKCGHRDVTQTFFIATPTPSQNWGPHKRQCPVCKRKVNAVAPMLLPIPRKRVA